SATSTSTPNRRTCRLRPSPASSTGGTRSRGGPPDIVLAPYRPTAPAPRPKPRAGPMTQNRPVPTGACQAHHRLRPPDPTLRPGRPGAGRWLRRFLRHYAATGRTVPLASHAPAEAAHTVDEVVILAAGRLVAHLSTADLAGRDLETLFLDLTHPAGVGP